MNSPFTHRKNGEERGIAVAGVLRHFSWAHLPPDQQPVGQRFAELAIAMADEMDWNSQLPWGLKQILMAKDEVLLLVARASCPCPGMQKQNTGKLSVPLFGEQ